MSLLTIIQDAALELGVKKVTAVVGSSDLLVNQLYSHLNEEGQATRDSYFFPELIKEKIITLVAGQDSYALPGDFNSFLFDTHWDRTNHWELFGPATPEEWQTLKSGIISLTSRRVFRVKGYATNQFFIYPTPDASVAGQIVAFEYLSRNWCRPRTWAQSQTYVANSFTFYEGNIYQTTSGGISGAEAPVHVSGISSDGGVAWTYFDLPYEKMLADTDIGVIEERVLKLGVKWRFNQSRNFQFEEDRQMHYLAASKSALKRNSAQTLSLDGGRRVKFGGIDNIPDGNWGI